MEFSARMRGGSWVRRAQLPHAQPAGRGRCVPQLRYFEAKNRSRITEYQCPAMSSALPAIENVISSKCYS